MAVAVDGAVADRLDLAPLMRAGLGEGLVGALLGLGDHVVRVVQDHAPTDRHLGGGHARTLRSLGGLLRRRLLRRRRSRSGRRRGRRGRGPGRTRWGPTTWAGRRSRRRRHRRRRPRRRLRSARPSRRRAVRSVGSVRPGRVGLRGDRTWGLRTGVRTSGQLRRGPSTLTSLSRAGGRALALETGQPAVRFDRSAGLAGRHPGTGAAAGDQLLGRRLLGRRALGRLWRLSWPPPSSAERSVRAAPTRPGPTARPGSA